MTTMIGYERDLVLMVAVLLMLALGLAAALLLATRSGGTTMHADASGRRSTSPARRR